MVIKRAKEVLRIEAEAILSLVDRIDKNFSLVVEIILKSKGRVIVTGVGKSGHIGRKIAATLASTGTPSFFLHPVEGKHGDLGMVTKDDIVLAISNSGEAVEINELIPFLKDIGSKLVAMTGNTNSTLAKNSDAVLNVHVDKEACPLGLAPTASTTTSLAMGDALAMTLLDKRGFKKEDYARFHPGGSLGKKARRKT